MYSFILKTSEGAKKAWLKRKQNAQTKLDAPQPSSDIDPSPEFGLNAEGFYEYKANAGGKITIDASGMSYKGKYHKEMIAAAKEAADWAGTRLFSGEVRVSLVNHHTLGALGASSTSPDGTKTQVMLNMGRMAKGMSGQADLDTALSSVIGTTIHELVHTYQRRQKWPEQDQSVPYMKRPQEVHAENLGNMLANQFMRERGMSVSPLMNTEKYFGKVAQQINAGKAAFFPKP